MPHAESIVLTFRPFRETAQTFVLPVCVKNLSPSGQNFVAVSLVPHIPYELIVRRVEDVMQCDGELYYTETGTEMTPFGGDYIYNEVSQFIADLRQLSLLDLGAKICGNINLTEERPCLICIHCY